MPVAIQKVTLPQDKAPPGVLRIRSFPRSEEEQFVEWYAGWAAKLGLNPDPDAPEHFYDYRAAFRAGATPGENGHWPSQFKLEGHPRMIVGGVNTKTGLQASLDNIYSDTDPKKRAEEEEKMGRSLAYSHLLDVPPDSAYEMEEEIKRQISTMIEKQPSPSGLSRGGTRSFEYGYREVFNTIIDKVGPTYKKMLSGLAWVMGESMMAESFDPERHAALNEYTQEHYGVTISEEEVKDSLNYKIGKALSEWGRKGSEEADVILREIAEEIPDELRGRLWDHPEYLLNPKWQILNAGDAAITLVPTIAAYILGGPFAAGTAGGGMEGIGLYDDLRKKGVSHDKALMSSTAFGVVSGILNAIGMEKVLGEKAVSGILSRMVHGITSGVWEGVTEYLEEPFQAVFGGIGEGKSLPEIIKDFGESWKNIEVAVGAFWTAGAAGTIAPTTERVEKKEGEPAPAEAKIEEKVEEVPPVQAPAEEEAEIELAPGEEEGLLPEEMEELPDMEPTPRQSELLSFIIRIGGLNPKDAQGELKRFTVRKSGYPRLVNKKGLTPDEARESVLEAQRTGELEGSYISEDSTVNDLYDAMNNEVNRIKFLGPKFKKPKIVTPEQQLIAKVKSIQAEKELSNITVARIRKFFGIEKLKKASVPELRKLADYLEGLEKGDQLLSPKQIEGLKDIIKDLPELEIIPKRIVVDTVGEKTDILPTGITGKIIPELIPTVDIKEGHPIIKKIVDQADDLLHETDQRIHRRNQHLNEMLHKAERSRSLSVGERLKRYITGSNREIFEALGGKRVDLTKQERAVVAYLRNFFKKVREDLELERYRKHYVTHLEQPLLERMLDKGLLSAMRHVFGREQKSDIPLHIMLELDNIIGSEKFFRFALERKGGVAPTTNIRSIVNTYSRLYETKMALDQILPEGQAVTQLLLQKKSAQWMKKFLQNLKGRGMDSNFRTGPMAWLARVADGIVDLGYLKLLALNYKSALKNLVAGEANSFITQDFFKYLEGKKRLHSNPKKTIRLAAEYGILDGLYYEYAQWGIQKFKRLRDLAMIGQKAGEYEIRASIFAAELTKEEWATGIIPPEKIREIKNLVAITQGRFSKTESPLWIQTWYGRMFMQMNRWRITNTMMLIRMAKGAAKDIKEGKVSTPNTRGLAKAFLIYGLAMWGQYELWKAGYKGASRVVQSMGELVNNIVEIVTLEPIIRAISSNPTYSVLKETAYSIQALASYIAPALVQEPHKIEIRHGIEESYTGIGGTLEDITGEEKGGGRRKRRPKRSRRR